MTNWQLLTAASVPTITGVAALAVTLKQGARLEARMNRLSDSLGRIGSLLAENESQLEALRRYRIPGKRQVK